MPTIAEQLSAQVEALEVLDDAYFALARQEDLTQAQQDVLMLLAPDEQTVKSNIMRARAIIDAEAIAGTAVQRQAAIDLLEQKKADAVTEAERIAAARKQLDEDERNYQSGVEQQAALVRRQSAMVDRLRKRLPDHIQLKIRQLDAGMFPMVDERSEQRSLRTALQFIIDAPEDGSVNELQLGSAAKEAGYTDVFGEEGNLRPKRLTAAKTDAAARLPDVVSRIEELDTAIDSRKAQIEALRDHYVQ